MISSEHSLPSTDPCIKFVQILEEHKRQGEEDHALVKRAEGKKAAARKRATRKGKNTLNIGNFHFSSLSPSVTEF